MLRYLFPFCLFLSAILLFSIQPMVAKSLLPIYGGTPAVWTVCMLFFQAILLASYAYVWLLSQVNKPIYWRLIHSLIIILSLIALPIAFKPEILKVQPEWSILLNLLGQMGIPLLVIGSTAPLVQFAYSQTKGKGASDPYFLYSASNIGSLLALLLYPWAIERWIGLHAQYHLWTMTYWVYLIVLLSLLFFYRYEHNRQAESLPTTVSIKERLSWIFLSFIPCSLMLGVTLYITTDVAATPLFWVLPLALYLLSFVLTFTKKPLISHQWIIRNSFFFLLFPVVGFILGLNGVRAWQYVLANLTGFFILALLCHGELYQRRPQTQSLTLFYFCLALGGVFAGLFNGVLAPHWFNQIYEYPLTILFCLLVLPQNHSVRRWWLPVLILILLVIQYYLPDFQWVFGPSKFQITCLIVLILVVLFKQTRSSLFFSMLILFLFLFSPLLQQNQVLLQERNFYGVKQVMDKEGIHVLISQSTVHGLQPNREKKPLSGYRSYYGALQYAIELLQRNNASMSVTIMGLGAGTMVCQHRASDELHVIEIDQQVIDLAKNSKMFTYLRDCPAKTHVIRSDGRLAIERLPNHSQHLLVLDAFNSDAIPVHLMTLEAFSAYKNKILDNGVILVNVSNRHLNILPVLNGIARSLDFMLFHLSHKGDARLGQFNSEWALLTTNQDFAFQLMNHTEWRFVADDPKLLWSDDYSNIIPLLRW